MTNSKLLVYIKFLKTERIIDFTPKAQIFKYSSSESNELYLYVIK